MILPSNDKMLVKVIKEETSAGGIVIAGQENDLMVGGTRAEVVRVGPGQWKGKDEFKERKAIEYQPGDIVILGKYGHCEIRDNGEEFVIVSEIDILAREVKS